MLFILTGTLAGCTGSANYTLHLTPVAAPLQSPFEGLDRMELVLSPGDGGEPLRVEMDSPTSGSTPGVGNLPALVDTRISVEGFVGDDLILRGMTEPLNATSGKVDTNVFVASTEKAAWLGPLTDGLYLPVLTALGEGRFWLAGGVTNNLNNEPNRGNAATYILTLAPPDEALAFTPLGELPAYETNDGASETARMGAGATTLTVADQGRILLTGGAPEHVWAGGQASTGASIYDPSTDSWEDVGALRQPRVGHLVQENLLGNVVIWGGYGAQAGGGSINLNNSLEYYDSANRTFSAVGTNNDLGPVDAMIADLGDEGTLVCGGVIFSGSSWSASDTCVRVKLDGSSMESFASLPDGLAGAAMVSLPDGTVLATGGGSPPGGAEAGVDVNASSGAWTYNPESERWAELSASMSVGRAGHRMVVMADGRVLIAGGARSFNTNVVPTDPVTCLDIYDPAAGTFEPVDGCEAGDETGGLLGGAYGAQVAYDPDHGVLIVGGIAGDRSADKNVALFVPGL